MATTVNSVACYFPKEMFGSIIGEKGAVIKAVRLENKVQITNDKDHTQLNNQQYRQLHIQGDWCQVWNAFCDIIRNISEGIEQGRLTQGAHLDEESRFTVLIKFPAEIAGMVIGKQGANLNEWRNRWSEAEFHVDNKESADLAVRYLRIKGTPFVLSEASVALADVLEQALTAKMVKGNGSLPLTKKITNPKRASTNTAVMADDMDFVSDAKRQMLGSEEKITRFSTLNAPAGAVGHALAGSECVSSLLVDDNIMGKIIGKGGEQIKTIRSSAGCSITTDRSGESADGRREIRLQGPIPQVQIALSMISAIMLTP